MLLSRPLRRSRARFEKYGITASDYRAMRRKQRDRCAVCRRGHLGLRGLVVDHDHKTGKVRGLLCVQCNVMLGMARDTEKTLLSGVLYLRHNTGIEPEERRHIFNGTGLS